MRWLYLRIIERIKLRHKYMVVMCVSTQPGGESAALLAVTRKSKSTSLINLIHKYIHTYTHTYTYAWCSYRSGFLRSSSSLLKNSANAAPSLRWHALMPANSKSERIVWIAFFSITSGAHYYIHTYIHSYNSVFINIYTYKFTYTYTYLQIAKWMEK